MSRKVFFPFFIIVFFVLVAYKLVFSPVSVTFRNVPDKVLTNSSSPIVVDVFQVNRLGFKIPFRHLNGRFIVNEGADKIDIVQQLGDEFIFRTRNSAGTLVISYYAREVPFPVQIILNIESASLA